MASEQMQRRVIGVGVFALPLVLVQVAGVLLGGGGPEDAKGGVIIPMPPTQWTALPVPTPDWSWSDQQVAAAEYVAALRSRSFGDAPFYYRKKAPDPGEGVIEVPVPDLLPDVEVQMILSAPSGNRALINGRPYGVGDLIDGIGWIVIEIDGKSYSVVLEHPETKRRTTITVRVPG